MSFCYLNINPFSFRRDAFPPLNSKLLANSSSNRDSFLQILRSQLIFPATLNTMPCRSLLETSVDRAFDLVMAPDSSYETFNDLEPRVKDLLFKRWKSEVHQFSSWQQKDAAMA